jgi:hypothetical protein
MGRLLDRSVRFLDLPYRLWTRFRARLRLGPGLFMLDLRTGIRSLCFRPRLRFLMGHRSWLRLKLGPRLLLMLNCRLVLRMSLWPDQVGVLRFGLRSNFSDSSGSRFRVCLRRPRLIDCSTLCKSRIGHATRRRLCRWRTERRSQRMVQRYSLRTPLIRAEKLSAILARLPGMHRLRRQRRQMAFP